MQYTLKELRARKDVNQKDAAKAIGVTVPQYSMLENLDTNIMSKLAKYYDVDVNEMQFPRR